MNDNRYDVLVVGGGMVGASLAGALAPLGLRVAVIERVAPGAPSQPSYDDRCTALSYGSRRIFETLGLWSQLSAAATPIRQIHVSDRGRFGVTRLDSAQEGVAALGYVVENRVLGACLWRSMGQATLYCPAEVAAVHPADDSVQIEIERDGGRIELRAALLVVADGARSATRTLLGIPAREHAYQQHAIIANITPQQPHRNVAYERFTAHGPIAMLPMSNGRCSLVWTQTPQQAAAAMTMTDEQFLAALQRAFGYRLGQLQRAGRRSAYPLALIRAASIVGPRAVLVGNAAHGLHPVAGQGFNLGLRDVAALAEVISESDDPGGKSALRRYQQWRRPDHTRVTGFTDGLIRIFGSELAPVRMARGAGLVALGLAPAARRLLARQSMGLSGVLPKLARGVPLQ